MRACRVRGVRLRAEGWDGVGVCGMGDGRWEMLLAFPRGKKRAIGLKGLVGWVGWAVCGG